MCLKQDWGLFDKGLVNRHAWEYTTLHVVIAASRSTGMRSYGVFPESRRSAFAKGEAAKKLTGSVFNSFSWPEGRGQEPE